MRFHRNGFMAYPITVGYNEKNGLHDLVEAIFGFTYLSIQPTLIPFQSGMAQVVMNGEEEHFPHGQIPNEWVRELALIKRIFLPFFQCRDQVFDYF